MPLKKNERKKHVSVCDLREAPKQNEPWKKTPGVNYNCWLFNRDPYGFMMVSEIIPT